MLVPLFTTFRGRISRKQWWIGFPIVVLISVAGEIYLNPGILSEEGAQPLWAETLWNTFWLIPITAIMVKRFNDRDWPWWFGWAVSVAMLFADGAPHFGVVIDPDAALPNAIAFWLVLALLLVSIIDNGFLRGTEGPNRYGGDPLAASAPVPAAA